MASKLGGELLGRALKREGVDALFYLMGGPTYEIINSSQDEGIRTVDVRHEQAAAYMAHAYARVSGKPGVCVSTSGPGTLNMATGIYNAFCECVPVVMLAGASALGQWGTGAFQEADQVEIYRPMTKWVFRAAHATRIPELVATAFRQALTGKPGPAFLDLPGDVLYTKVNADDIEWPTSTRTEARPQGDPAAVKQAIELLTRAERPLIFAGSGTLWSRASDELRQFVELTDVPFYTTPQARGVVPDDHALSFPAARSLAFREVDVLLVVGSRFNWMLQFGRRFTARTRVIQVDIDAGEIGHNRSVDVGIVGDAKAVLRQMLAEADGRFPRRGRSPWAERLAEDDERHWKETEPLLTSDKQPIHPLRLCQEVREFLPRDAIVVVDGNEILHFGRQSIPTFFPGHRLNSGVTGCMGVGLPYGIGAKVAKPDKPVLVLHGDGSFGMNAMELDTAVRHNLPVVCVISNNAGWTAREPGFRKPGRELGHTRYDKTAESLGCYAEHVEKPEDIKPALERAFASGRPALVNVVTDPLARAISVRASAYREV